MRITQLPTPVLAGVINQKSKDGAISDIKNCTFAGADIIDLHLETLEERNEEVLKEIIKSSKLPVLALNYVKTTSEEDTEAFEMMRIESFLTALEAGAAGIDMQGYTFDIASKTSPDFKLYMFLEVKVAIRVRFPS